MVITSRSSSRVRLDQSVITSGSGLFPLNVCDNFLEEALLNNGCGSRLLSSDLSKLSIMLNELCLVDSLLLQFVLNLLNLSFLLSELLNVELVLSLQLVG